jgi:eukaryotic-like serine/threonine-protein kinase
VSGGLKICPQCGAEYQLDQRFCPQDGTTLRLQNGTGDLVGSIVADRYHVLRKLGEGGMGQVYLAEHVKMGRKSALKVMNPAMVKDADAISRFNREAANASHINHPNVADVYDFGETPDGIIYLAMEFVDGPPLTKLIADEGPLPPARTASIVRQAADALAVAHDMGIVHRDLKPDNIMIARGRDGNDVVKVVDFGIAKAADNAAQKVTKTGLVVGTPEYMSPEQLAGDKLDGRSDIYALALVAFNMLTGRLPFPAETVQESMIMRLTEPPRKLADMRPEVAWSAEVQSSLDKALQRDVKARYQTATEFGKSVSAALEKMATPSPGTQVRGSIAKGAAEPQPSLPPTRVAAERLPAPPPEFALVEPATPRVALSRNRRMIALSAGGVILVAASLGAAMVYRRDPGKSVVPDSVTHRSAAPSVTGPQDSAKTRQLADTTAVPNVEKRLADVGKTLDSLEQIVEATNVSPNEAARVIRHVEEMNPRIQGNEQVVKAAYVNALAYSSRGDNKSACAALRQVRTIAPKTSLASVFANAQRLAC